MHDFGQIRNLFRNKTSRKVSFTDSNDYTDEDEIRINRTLGEMFEQIFPNKSAFEK